MFIIYVFMALLWVYFGMFAYIMLESKGYNKALTFILAIVITPIAFLTFAFLTRIIWLPFVIPIVISIEKYGFGVTILICIVAYYSWKKLSKKIKISLKIKVPLKSTKHISSKKAYKKSKTYLPYYLSSYLTKLIELDAKAELNGTTDSILDSLHSYKLELNNLVYVSFRLEYFDNKEQISQLNSYFQKYEDKLERYLEIKVGDDKCSLCKSSMRIEHGKFGVFLGCSNYQSCESTVSLKNYNILNKVEAKCSNT